MGAQGAVGCVYYDVIDVDQAKQFGGDAGFLMNFPECCGASGLSGFDVPAGEAPNHFSGLFTAQANEQASVVAKDCSTGCRLWPMRAGRMRFIRRLLGDGMGQEGSCLVLSCCFLFGLLRLQRRYERATYGKRGVSSLVNCASSTGTGKSVSGGGLHAKELQL